MNLERKNIIEEGEGLIYHELGHLFSYVLSNRNDITSLGEVESMNIGIKENAVTPTIKLYHFEKSALKNYNIIQTNTSNKSRTIAWIIEVIAGCTFQSIFENKSFNRCFGPDKELIGKVDFDNLSFIRPICAFNWNFNQVFDLQKGFINIIYNHEILDKISTIANHLKQELIKSENIQISLKGDELSDLVGKIDNLIEVKLIEDYNKLIKNNVNIMI